MPLDQIIRGFNGVLAKRQANNKVVLFCFPICLSPQISNTGGEPTGSEYFSMSKPMST